MLPHEAKVFVADDHEGTIEAVRRSMRTMGFLTIGAATDGYRALIALKQSPCDLLIVDWNLPRLNGLALAEQLRRIPRYGCPKIMLMTSKMDRELLETAVSHGVGAFLVKPFTAIVLKEQLEKVLGAKIS